MDGAGILANDCSDALIRRGIRVLARVPDGARTTDLAVALHSTQLAVVRCVDLPNPAHYAALKTMVAEGDFIWAALVYGDHNGSGPESPIESFHLTEIDKLIARLRALGAQAHEAS